MKRVWIVPRTPKAKIAQWIGIIAGILMVLFPPWDSFPEFIGYHPLWQRLPGDIDVCFLLVQLILLAIITKTAVRILNRYPSQS